VLERLKPSGDVLIALAVGTTTVKEAPYQNVLADTLGERVAPRPHQAVLMCGMDQLIESIELLTGVERASWNKIVHKTLVLKNTNPLCQLTLRTAKPKLASGV
jgi:hypothetical protein